MFFSPLVVYSKASSLQCVLSNFRALKKMAKEGSQSFEQFLAAVERRAFITANIATRDRDEALDIVQDAMLKMVQRYRERPANEWGPLFNRVLHSKIMDWYRRRKVRQNVMSWFKKEEDDDNPIASSTVYSIESAPANNVLDPLKQMKEGKAMTQLQTALTDLPIRQQQVFMLRIWEEYSVAETAGVMKCSQGSVKTHLSRALAKLREQLGEHWP